ncbi:YkgJ family cysteine cluster protein [Halorubrum ezzemoulense]|uniref:YkgJ family cysteine cluster protein n=1 Tax=Halorubrum ezzemoulense TaxID=337243 RepID=A0ABT4Z227_HALEZ|nr:YkgJ family cysteine cluster protein [Halorubrum ezzemoulense]MDB2244227.1 YkgJ family cysteine cluster protein [Halorubrum ezzemoulense]MDB2252327.1 YkgJ family cysteine cluster protein [Halorubrum ezzemoulense]MDB2277962.1 YkgJ family cysteine cluster protein [Halorubrum ezzemoulense]MDB2289589.1 YkgJ family cysteine cluster protein [Halorubrum ezzemoulense]MDB2292202.1 YkgJ family cysteine cluster protein [Halorubrum ezzemoulense]
MELRCEGCAGCCVDWRPLDPAAAGSDRTGPRPPLDDTYDLVPLTRDEVVDIVDDGLGDALVPRLFEPAERDERVRIDGTDLAAIDGRPVFVVGLRKPPKPVAPIGTDEPRWLGACAFLDPTTLQCRIHGDDRYPRTCSSYPGHNLELDAETECERVEAAGGGDRLLDDEPADDLPAPAFGPQALGATVFAYPDPEDLDGVVARLRDGGATADDRARFAGAAVGSRPGSLSVTRDRMAEARDDAREADSWVGSAIREWTERAGADGERVGLDRDARDRLARAVEDDAGAPGTPGWDAER